MLDALPQLTIALALALLLMAGALHKLRARDEWPGVVRNYRLLPAALAGPTAAIIPAAEALVAATLLSPATRALGGVAAAALLLVYAAALAVNLRRGRTTIDCGCFGSRLSAGIAPWMVWRNVGLAGLALLLQPTSARALSVAEVGVAAAAVATLAFLYPVLSVVARPRLPTFDQNYRAADRTSR